VSPTRSFAASSPGRSQAHRLPISRLGTDVGPVNRLDGDPETGIGLPPASERSNAVDAMDRAPDLDPGRASGEIQGGSDAFPARSDRPHGPETERVRMLCRANGDQASLHGPPRLAREFPIRERGRKDDEPVGTPVTHSEWTRPSAIRPSPALQFGGPSAGELPSVPTSHLLV